MMRKDEVPVVTLVLMHSRVLLFYDWLNDAKSFVMLCTDFIPKCEFLVSLFFVKHCGRQSF